MEDSSGKDTLLGALFESLAVLSVRVFAQAADAMVSHLRTRNGDHEVDIIVERDDHSVLAIEVKLSGQAPEDDDTRHLNWLQRQIGDRLIDRVVINTGEYAYRSPEGVAVLPLSLLGP
jgi:predicted AAA+ superfamily ATPase